MKFLCATCAVLMCVVSSAEEAKPEGTIKVGNKTMTKEQLHATIRRVQEKKTGGVIRQANSAKGVLGIINAQKRVPSEAIEPVLQAIDHWIRIQTKVLSTDKSIAVSNVESVIKDGGVTAGIVLVEDSGLPTLLTAPEGGWAIINVAKLDAGSPSAEVLSARARKEILRSAAFILGGVYTAKADPLMRDIKQPGDLDRSPIEAYGIETINAIRESASFYGVTPWVQATYRQACEQGWAPTPTNEFQKAIWNEFHELPSKPIQIKPEAKPVKE